MLFRSADRMNAPTLFDSVRLTDPQTSRDAAASMAPHLSGQRARVLALVREHGDITAAEIARTTGHTIQQSVAARRLTDLAQMGLIEPTGVTRPGNTGRMCTVWTIATTGGNQ